MDDKYDSDLEDNNKLPDRSQSATLGQTLGEVQPSVQVQSGSQERQVNGQQSNTTAFVHVRKRKQKSQLTAASKLRKNLYGKTAAAAFQTIMKPDGTQTTVRVVPTSNKFSMLDGAAEEIRLTKSTSTSQRSGTKSGTNVEAGASSKARIPPITVIGCTRVYIETTLKELNIKNYSLKLLRHGINLYCTNVQNFKAVRAKFAQLNVSNYSHDLPEDKCFKVALNGLHKMSDDELLTELKNAGLNSVAVRAIAPQFGSTRQDVTYIVSFPKGTTTVSELNRDHYAVVHTRIRWAPYRHKGGIVQCSKCQRPGHGVRYCNMPPRCRWCAGEHESKLCDAVHKAIQSNAVAGNADHVTTEIFPKCCNCKVDGHYATDPNCPKRVKYVNMRQKKSAPATQSTSQTKKVNADSHLRYSPGGASYSETLRNGTGRSVNNPGKNDFSSPSGNLGPSGNLSPSGNRNRPSGRTYSNGNCPSDNLHSDPFSEVELSAFTREIFKSLRDVRHLPREEAMFRILDITFKYLYKNDSR